MKKLFTLLLGLACLCNAGAQTLTFRNEGKVITDGETVYSGKVNEILSMFQVCFAPEITLTSDEDAEICIRLKAIDQEAGFGICSFDGNCVPAAAPDYQVVKTGEVKAGVPEDALIEYQNGSAGPMNAGTYTKTAEISAWYVGKESEKVTFTLVMTNDENLLSVSDVRSAGDDAISVKGGVLRYAYAQAAARELSVYAVNGAQVLSQPLSVAEGSVSLSALPKGVYVARITDGVKASVCRFIQK